MSNRLIQRVLAAVALIIVGSCYQDDFSGVARGRPLVRVSLTDAPFPYDSVTSVNIYVVRIEASTQLDTSGGGTWVLITEPRKTFDLLGLQQGATAFVGEGELPAGQYQAIRMTIDTSLSSIGWGCCNTALVNWQNHSGSSEMQLYAFVEHAFDVPPEGADIVIDFDVGRSFLYAFYGNPDFTFIPNLRAINSAASGAIAGTVTAGDFAPPSPIKNANITVCGADPCDPPNAYVVATGRSDDTGYYKVAFLGAGLYTVRIEPEYPSLQAVITHNVQVTAGETTALSVVLSQPTGPYVRVSGPSSVGVGGTIALIAVVGDANGNPVLCTNRPTMIWTSSDTNVAKVIRQSPCYVPPQQPEDTGFVYGVQPGFATITATSGTLSGSLTIQVAGLPNPVATVTVTPGSANAAVGDSLVFNAVARDSAGNLLYNRAYSWFSTDSTVFVIETTGGSFDGSYAAIRARGPGSASLRATSEGKVGQAAITVH